MGPKKKRKFIVLDEVASGIDQGDISFYGHRLCNKVREKGEKIEIHLIA